MYIERDICESVKDGMCISFDRQVGVVNWGLVCACVCQWRNRDKSTLVRWESGARVSPGKKKGSTGRSGGVEREDERVSMSLGWMYRWLWRYQG